MAIANFIPELWSQSLNVAFRKNYVFRSLVNTDYEGEIRQQGDTVHIVRPNSLTIKNYTGTVEYEIPTSTDLALVIDQAYYWAFAVDDVEKVQANVNLISAYTEEGGQDMANAVDEYLASLYTDVAADNVIVKASYDADTIYAAYVEAQARLNIQNVPQAGRWATVDARTYSFLVSSPEFIRSTALGDTVVQTGQVGMIAGFNIFLTNNAAVASDGTHEVTHLMYGSRRGITFANQLTEMESLRLEGQFGDGVRALMLFGAKVVRPEAVGEIRIQGASVTS